MGQFGEVLHRFCQYRLVPVFITARYINIFFFFLSCATVNINRHSDNNRQLGVNINRHSNNNRQLGVNINRHSDNNRQLGVNINRHSDNNRLLGVNNNDNNDTDSSSNNINNNNNNNFIYVHLSNQLCRFIHCHDQLHRGT